MLAQTQVYVVAATYNLQTSYNSANSKFVLFKSILSHQMTCSTFVYLYIKKSINDVTVSFIKVSFWGDLEKAKFCNNL